MKAVSGLALIALGLATLVQPADADDDVVINAGKDGFSLQSRGGAFAIKFRGGIQADSRWFLADTKKQNVDTFLGRRARPIVEGTVHERYDFRMMWDLVDGRSNLLDAYLDVRPSEKIKVRFGKYKPPVSLERLQSFPDVRFVERGYPSSIAPNRDYGVMVHGDVLAGTLSYAAGLFNGVVDGGSGDSDTNDGKDLVARLFTHPFKNNANSPLNGLGFGIAATKGDQAGAPASYRSTGQASIFSFVQNVTVDDERTRIQPQGYYYRGPLGLLGEFARSEQTVKKDGKKTSFKAEAWEAEATYLLTGEKASYRGIVPNSPFNFYGGKGAFELAARVQSLDLDDVVFTNGVADQAKSVRRADTYSGGLNWYLNKNARFTVNYELTEFRRGAAAGSNRRTERVISTRYQLAY